jgi:hypothetical protein
VFVNLKEITYWILEKGTIVAIEVSMATRYKITVRHDSKVEEEEEVCTGGWEEAILLQVECCGNKSKVNGREENRVLMCLGLWNKVENKKRFNQVVSQPFLFIYVRQYKIVNIDIRT